MLTPRVQRAATLLVAAIDSTADVEGLLADRAGKSPGKVRNMPPDTRARIAEELLQDAGIEQMVLEAALAALQATEALALLEGQTELARDLERLRSLADKTYLEHFGDGLSIEVSAIAREALASKGQRTYEMVLAAAERARRAGGDQVEAARQATRWELLVPGGRRPRMVASM